MIRPISLDGEMAIYPSKVSVFMLGFTIGVIVAFIVTVSKNRLNPIFLKSDIFLVGLNEIRTTNEIENDSYDLWLDNEGYVKSEVNFDHYSYSGNKTLNELLEFNLLKAKVNILCVMFIQNINNAYAAMNTWMKHCNTLKFYSMKSQKYIEVTVIQPKSSWQFLCEIIKHVDNNVNDYMWVLFVPDDVYAIPENLRHYVFGKNFLEPHYFGHAAVLWNVHYNLAQAGYVLSKGSVKSIVNKFHSTDSCKTSGKYWKNEDYYLGKYLSELGVTPIDTSDHFGRGRFHVFTPSQLMAPGNEEVLSKYWKSSLYPVTQGRNCCSPRSITFQGTDRAHIYFYHYLLYSLHVHKVPGHLGNIKSSTYIPTDQIWQEFVLNELGSQANLSAITPNKYYKLWSDKIDSPSIFNKKLRALFVGETDD